MREFSLGFFSVFYNFAIKARLIFIFMLVAVSSLIAVDFYTQAAYTLGG
ncbi:MAG: hypothetical protein ACE5FN_10915 [Leptospirillia bacterium]